MYIKELSLTCILFSSTLADYLSGLKEFRHENVNRFKGCYMTPCSFSLIFEYCSQGSLQVILGCVKWCLISRILLNELPDLTGSDQQ